MKCITMEHEFYSNHHTGSRYVGTTVGGVTTELLPQDPSGIKATLDVDVDGFILRNNNGELLRKGKETDVFAIYDSMQFSILGDGLLVTANSFNGSFTEYENKYGFDRVERTEKVKYLAYSERLEGASVFGLVKVHYGKTLAIHSLYVDKPLSNRERASFLADYVYGQLNANETASITIVGGKVDKANGKHPGVVRLHSSKWQPKYEQARLLAEDAAERETSISERFTEPMRYQIQGIFGEDTEGEC
jgi:hypothetical protein